LRRRLWLLLTALLALSVAAAGVALAHPEYGDGGSTAEDGARDLHQHGDTAGHLPATQENVDLVSKLRLDNVVPEKIADVGVHKGYAYLAAWGQVTCEDNGVHVVDIRNAAQPREVKFIRSKPGSYPGEGIQTVTITTPKFSGDVLVSNNEKCNENTGYGGVNLYDVTRPTKALPLFEGAGDTNDASGVKRKQANEIHSAFAWDAGDKAYVVIVDNVEATDVDILDITDPRSPKLIAEYNLAEEFPQILQDAPPNLVEVFLHDMIIKEIGGRQVMLLSYWDAGYVKLDMTNPKNPEYLGDTDFTNPDPEAAESGLTVPPEGNGHQAEFTKNNDFVIGSDEDFNPYALRARNVDDDTDLTASQGSDTTQLKESETITGDAVFVGRACPGDPAVPAAPTTTSGKQIAVVERGVCTFTEKVTSVTNAGGYEAVLIINREGSDACNASLGMSVEGDIPTFGVAPREQGFAIFGVEDQYNDAECLAGDGTRLAPIQLGTVGDTLTFSSYFDGWGYVHLFDNSDGKMAELDTYAIPEAHDPAYATGSGDLSVHEVATSPTRNELAYFSYYAGGFRVAEIQDGELVEVGRFIDQGGSNFWGVQVFKQGGQEYVAASDRDFGLYIFKYTGAE